MLCWYNGVIIEAVKKYNGVLVVLMENHEEQNFTRNKIWNTSRKIVLNPNVADVNVDVSVAAISSRSVYESCQKPS